MDDFKDVMLSELPTHHHHHHQPSYTSQLTSLENYKGILLCDRPTDARMSMGIQQQPFLPPGKIEDRVLGLQPSMERRAANDLSKSLRTERTRRVPPTALSRHKIFLRKLNEQVRETQNEAVEKIANKEEQRKRFQKSQEKYRNMLKDAADMQAAENSGQAIARPSSASAAQESYAPKPPTPPRETANNNNNNTNDAPSKASNKSKKEKPTWAMTEDEALDHELNEAQKLVDFAQGLDFDSFINDYEVRQAIAVLAERVKEIQEGAEIHVKPERGSGDKGDTASVAESDNADPSKPSRRKQSDGLAKHEKGWDSSTVAEAVKNALSADSLVLADRILNKSDHLRQIYSKQALARMLQDAFASSALDAPGVMKAPNSLPPVRPKFQSDLPPSDALGPSSALSAKPIVSVVGAESQFGADRDVPQKRILVDLKKSKEHVQNLPYLYRCPSI